MVEKVGKETRDSVSSLLALVHHPFHARAFEACLVLTERHCPKEG